MIVVCIKNLQGPSVKEMLSFQQNLDREHFAASLASHPTLPFYVSVSGAHPSRILLWHYGKQRASCSLSSIVHKHSCAITCFGMLGWPNALAEFTPRVAVMAPNGQRKFVTDKTEHITRIRFNAAGNKLAATT